MHRTESFDRMIHEFRDLIVQSVPPALKGAGVPKEDHESVMKRVLGRLPSSATAKDGMGLNPALVVGLGLLDRPRPKKRALDREPLVSEDVRKTYTGVAFNDYLWDAEEHLDVPFDELPAAFDLILVTHDIGCDRAVDIVELTDQIEIFRRIVKSPLQTKIGAYAAYHAKRMLRPSFRLDARIDLRV